MTDTEKNYAQIEKDLLAICYACHKFHQYVYGKPVKVQTDHSGGNFQETPGQRDSTTAENAFEITAL